MAGGGVTSALCKRRHGHLARETLDRLFMFLTFGTVFNPSNWENNISDFSDSPLLR